VSFIAFSPDLIDAHRLLVQVSAGRTTTVYDRYQRIYSQGEDADVVFFVQHGAAEITVKPRHGLETAIGIAKEGQFFGGTCLYDVPLRVATATAILDSRITAITKEAILTAIRERPRFAKMFIDHLWHNTVAQKDLLDRLLRVAEAA
jgi:CRP-like cAMP-binding protein